MNKILCVFILSIIPIVNLFSQHDKSTIVAKTGGFITRPISKESKKIILLDCKKDSHENPFTHIEFEILKPLRLPYEVIKGDYSEINKYQEHYVIALCDCNEVAYLPHKNLVTIPITCSSKKNITEALYILFGVDTSLPSIRKNGALLTSAKNRGIPQLERTTYRLAVKEGWAPAPTNDIQRAVWDKVKADMAVEKK